MREEVSQKLDSGKPLTMETTVNPVITNTTPTSTSPITISSYTPPRSQPINIPKRKETHQEILAYSWNPIKKGYIDNWVDSYLNSRMPGTKTQTTQAKL